jgi:hypothetical protein
MSDQHSHRLERPGGTAYDGGTSSASVDTGISPASPISPPTLPRQAEVPFPAEPTLSTDIVDAGLCGPLTNAAATLEETLDRTVPANLRPGVEDWCALHGLDTDSLTEQIPRLARHAVLAVLLKAVLYERHHRAGRLPPLEPPVDNAFQTAHHQLETSAFDRTILDDIAAHLNDKALQEILDASEQVLDARYPAVSISRLYAELTDSETR